MKRLYLFCYYYFYSLREPVHGVNVRSVLLAWHLAGIAAMT